jgi:hypothetical protein
MPKVPEVRCPECGSLYNVEPCNETVHACIAVRKEERAKVISFFLTESGKDTTVVQAAVNSIVKKMMGQP